MRSVLLCLLLVCPLGGREIGWREETRTLVAEGGGYGRMARAADGRLLCAYSRRGALCVKDSADEGRTWGAEKRIGTWRHGAVTNAELLVRRNGEVLCFFNLRPERDAPADARFSIGFHRSGDGGRTWGEAVVLYQAGREFENGCWEPAGLELPDGELQVYFANEGPYRETNEQEISLLRSRDGGRMWSDAVTVCFRKGARDGMPVPMLVPQAEGIALAIEDNGLLGAFKPVIVASSWSGGGWTDGAVDGESRRRWGALADPLPAEAYAGAPYLRRLGPDATVLSFQLAENGKMEDARMAVCLGDGRARRFGRPSFPFPGGTRQLWNSLFAKDEETVTAVSEMTRDGRRGIWAIDGVVE